MCMARVSRFGRRSAIREARLGAQTGRRGGAGPAGGLLGGKDPTGRVFVTTVSSLHRVRHTPPTRPGDQTQSPPEAHGSAPSNRRDGRREVVITGQRELDPCCSRRVPEFASGFQDNFSANPRDHFDEFTDVDIGTHESNMAVREQNVGPARMEAVYSLVVAVDAYTALRPGS